MTLIDALLNFATTAGTGLGLFGALVIVAGAVMSFFVDETHPALQPAETDTEVQPFERVASDSSDRGALAVAA